MGARAYPSRSIRQSQCRQCLLKNRVSRLGARWESFCIWACAMFVCKSTTFNNSTTRLQFPGRNIHFPRLPFSFRVFSFASYPYELTASCRAEKSWRVVRQKYRGLVSNRLPLSQGVTSEQGFLQVQPLLLARRARAA